MQFLYPGDAQLGSQPPSLYAFNQPAQTMTNTTGTEYSEAGYTLSITKNDRFCNEYVNNNSDSRAYLE